MSRIAPATGRTFLTELRSWLVVLALACLLATVSASELWACPMCKAALGSHDPSHGDWVGGFFWSILFMVSMPFLLLGSFTGYMYVLVRRARRAGADYDAKAGARIDV